MRSGWLYRISRCIQPKACELSFYHHGSDPPKTIKQILKNGDRDSFPNLSALPFGIRQLTSDGLFRVVLHENTEWVRGLIVQRPSDLRSRPA